MRPQNHRHHGIAMILVLSAISMAVILGVALLSTATLQTYTGRNTTAAVSADALAESGIDLACYYLVYPEKATFSGSFWPGATGITFGPGVGGSVDVTVTSAGANLYTITATGTDAAGLQRSATASILLSPGFRVQYGAAFASSPIVIPSGSLLSSDIQVDGDLTNYGHVTGIARTKNQPTNFGSIDGGWIQLTAASTTAVPASGAVQDYSTYQYKGITYSAKALPSVISPSSTFGPTADNPAGVFKAGGQLEIQGNVTINGTLIVGGGPLKITGGGIKVTPFDGFPAATIQGDLQLIRSKLWTPQITLNGLVWLNGNIKSPLSGLGPAPAGSLNVNGSLLVPHGTIDNPLNSRVNITFDKNKVAGVQLDPTTPPPSVQIRSFK